MSGPSVTIGTLSDVFALQDEIALAVVSAIEPSLRGAGDRTHQTQAA